MKVRPGAHWGLLGGLLGAGALAVSGCGASNAIDPVARAANTSTSAPGFRMHMILRIASPQLPAGTMTGSGDGTIDSRERAGALSLAMTFPGLSNNPQAKQALGGNTLKLEELFEHLTLYMKLPSALRSRFPGGRPWVKLDLAKAAAAAGMPGLSSLSNNPAGNDPSQMLGYLRASAGHFQNLGKAEVNGIQTTHYKASVSLDKIPSRFPPSQRQAIQQTTKTLESRTGLRSLPVDVWIDRRNLVRRMQFAFGENLPNAGTLHLAIQMDITGYGPQPVPSLPPPSQVTDITSQASAASAG